MYKIIRKGDYDLIHSHKINIVIGNFAAKLACIPAVQTYHEANKLGLWIYRFFNFLIEPFVDRLIVLFVMPQESSSHLCWQDKPKVIKIYNGINLHQFSAELSDPEAARNELKLPKSAPVVITIGRLQNNKGYEYFIRSAALVVKKIPNAHFLLIGDINAQTEEFIACQDSLHKLVQDLNLEFLISILLEYEEILLIYAA